jgi:ElaB/YqjD/DUF883 family membrane-anchored ribosome-binding protein
MAEVKNRPTGQQASSVMEGLKEKAQDVASTVATKAEEALDTAQQGARQAASYVGRQAENAWGGLTDCMSRYPVATFVVGVGLGIFLGRAFFTDRSWNRL